MKPSFESIWHLLDESIHDDILFDDDENVINLIQKGLELDNNFWNNFMRICANADAMSDMLGVSKDKVKEWPSKIKKYLLKHESHKRYKKNQVIHTGDKIF